MLDMSPWSCLGQAWLQHRAANSAALAYSPSSHSGFLPQFAFIYFIWFGVFGTLLGIALPLLMRIELLY